MILISTNRKMTGMKKTNRKTYRKKTRPTLAKKVAKIARVVKAQKPEVKYVESTGTGKLITNDYDSTLQPCQNIAIGSTDYGTRIGDKIRIQSLNYKFQIHLASGAPSRPCRIIVFQYKNNPDAVLTTPVTITNLLMESAYANSTRAVLATYDWDNKSSFRVLYDKTRMLETQPLNTNTGAQVNEYLWSVYVPLKNVNREVSYYQGTSFPTKNEIFVLMITDIDGNMSCDYLGRMTYTDA